MSNTERKPRKESRLIPVSDFVIEEGFNTREDFGDLEQLGRDLKATYERNPFDIPPIRGHANRGLGTFTITDGERRLRAAKLAGIPTLPFLPFSEVWIDRLMAQISLNAGKQFNELEKAKHAERISQEYRDQNPDAQEKEVVAFVTSSMGIAPASLYNYRNILKAPKDVQEQVKPGIH
jgi:hypothetical protein